MAVTNRISLKDTMSTSVKSWRLAALTALSLLLGGAAQAATPYATASVTGALAPGVYGRIDIGNAPPPTVIYAQPIIIQQVPQRVRQPPLYLHVPPGHAKKWSKHCASYNACGRPVYFVRVQGDDAYERRRVQDNYRVYESQHDKHDDKHHDNGHGKGHDKGHGRGHDKR